MKKGIVMLTLCGALCFGIEASAQRDTVNLQEVVVTGTGTQHLLKNTPVQTEVISRKMLDSFGGKSIQEILSGLTASFDFNEGDMGSQMQLNGLGNNYILILIDGKRIHGDVGGENDLGLIDPNNIDHIEIVKGAQSALYGSDAMAGVVNIITKRSPLAPEGGILSGLLFENTTRYGSYNDVRQHNGVGFRVGKLQSYTNFQLQHTDGWQNTSEEYAEGKVFPDSRNMTRNKFTNWQVAEHLTYDFFPSTGSGQAPRFSMYADGSYYTKGIYRPTNGNYASCDVYTYDLLYHNASAAIGGKWRLSPALPNREGANTSKQPNNQTTKEPNNYLQFDVDWNKHAYYYEYTARTYEYKKLIGDEYGEQEGEWFSVPYYPSQKNLQSDQHRVMAQVKGVFHMPYENTINTGLEYRYDYLNAPERTENGSASDWTGALYVQDEFNMIKWFNLTAGVRLVDNGNFGFRATPKVSTMFSLGDFRIRLGWSQGFKTPTPKELYYRYLHVMGSTTFFNMGNTSLKPQTSNYVSGSLEYRGKHLTASVTGYYNKLKDMIALVNVPVGEIPPGVTSAYLGDGSGEVTACMYKNMEDAMTYGVDVNVNVNLNEEWTVGGNYSYLDTKANQYDTDKSHLLEVTIDGMAHHKWNAFVTWNHRFCSIYKLGVNLSTRGSSMRYYQNNGNGEPYQVWRLNTTHDFGKAHKSMSYRVELGIDNIFNYKDTTMHPYHLGTTTPGTTIFASFSIRFNSGKKVKSHNIKSIKNEDNENND